MSGKICEITKPHVTFEQDFSQLEIQENQEKKILPSNEIARFLKDLSSLIDESLQEIKNSQFQSCFKLILKVLSIKLESTEQESSKSNEDNHEAITKCEEQIQSLIEKIPCNKGDMFTLMKKLIDCKFHFIQTFFVDEKDRLYKFGNFISFLKNIMVSRKNNQTLKENFMQLYDMLDEVLMEIYDLEDIDTKEKSKQVAWFLIQYARCSSETKDYKKSIDLLTKAIVILEYEHGRNADRLKNYSHSLSNLASAYESSEKYEEARDNYDAAVKAYKNASGLSEKDRKDKVSSNLRNKDRVAGKLSRAQQRKKTRN